MAQDKTRQSSSRQRETGQSQDYSGKGVTSESSSSHAARGDMLKCDKIRNEQRSRTRQKVLRKTKQRD